MSDYRARWEGRECWNCGVKRGLMPIYVWHPGKLRQRASWERVSEPEVIPPRVMVTAQCLDRATCRARKSKREERARLRGSRIEISEPPGDEAQRRISGHCSWCGEPMYRVNKAGERVLDKTRSYHNDVKGDGNCRAEHSRSYSYDSRWAVSSRARNEGLSELRCADCGVVCEWLDRDAPDVRCVCGHRRDEHAEAGAAIDRVCLVDGCTGCAAPADEPWKGRFRPAHVRWEADHEIELEDGGEHAIENLCCRCCPCHARKTAAARAARRAA